MAQKVTTTFSQTIQKVGDDKKITRERETVKTEGFSFQQITALITGCLLLGLILAWIVMWT